MRDPFSRYVPAFGGLKVMVSPDRPGYILPADLPLPDDFRARVNAWAAGFFEPLQLLSDGQTIFDQERGIVLMNPRTLRALEGAMPFQSARGGDAR